MRICGESLLLCVAGAVVGLNLSARAYAQSQNNVRTQLSTRNESMESKSESASSMDAAPASDQPKFFFDARSTGFTREGSQKVFEGDVIAIGARSLVTADKVTIDEKNHFLVAEGHVIILSNGQYITGEKVEMWGDTGDAKVTGALLVINDTLESDRIANEVLGYTSSEIEFEAHRKERLNEVTKKKDDVRQEARQRAKQGQSVPDGVVQEYARYLEQEDLITRQENPAFAQMSEARRQTLRRRRDFWQQARLSEKVAASPGAVAYFRMSGETLERTNGNDFRARDGVWTPCHCEKDEAPAWAFRSSTIDAQPGGYATFNNAVLEIKGVPILYLPWFRVPIKDRRQSGLLMPIFSEDSISGSTYSQPLFLDLGEDKDVTLKADLFERRGTRLGAEARYKRRKYSGFQLNGEVIRDRIWLTQRENRLDQRELYFSGLAAAREATSETSIQDYSGRDYAQQRLRQRSYWTSHYPACLSDDPAERKACEESLAGQMSPPSNDMRGLMKWRGQERLGERLSVVTTGEIYSDRRYNSDLYVPDSFEAGFETGTGERAIQPARAQMHYDGKDYYLGLGSHAGDYVENNDRYEGYQMPLSLRARSRWYRLGQTGVPIYGSAMFDQHRFSRLAGNTRDPESTRDYIPSSWWRRAMASFVAPISAKTAVQVDHFTDFEARHLDVDVDAERTQDSTIQSMRTGLRFRLPIDGKSPMPRWLGDGDIEGEDGTRYIQHVMNWSMTLTGRPSVVRRGPYADPTSSLAEKTPGVFMATDVAGSDENIPAEDYMSEYQLVTFETSHRWKVFSEVWRRISPSTPEGGQRDSSPKDISWDERARRELLYSMDRPVRSDEEMFSENQTDWFINRYQLLDTDYIEPVTFSASISYDRLKDVRRQREGRTVENRPWTEPDASLGVSVADWSLSANSKYNIYEKLATKHALSLRPPSLLSTNLAFGYTLERVPVGGDGLYNETRERSVTVVSSLTSPIFTTWSWSKKETQDTTPNDYRQKIGLVYASSSKCWGLGFSREKGYNASEANATYLLQLSITFMGQVRDLPNVGSAVDRELKKS